MADCVANKIDSNATGLFFAETICGVLPTVADDGYEPTWYELEPNEYSGFGGDLSTMARTPINAGRQRKKGVVVDFDASAGFQQDFTQNNFNRLLQGFFFAKWREKFSTRMMNETALTVDDVSAGDSEYQASGDLGFVTNHLIKASGFTESGNNGLFPAVAVTGNTVEVSGSLTDETPTNAAQLEAVGYRFPSGELSMSVSGDIGTLNITTAPVAATGDLTVDAGNAAPGDTITIGDVEYTFISGTPSSEGEIPVGADDVETAENVASAINGDVMHTPPHPDVEAFDNGDGTVTVTALVPGTTGNLIGTETDGANLSFASTALSGGTGISFLGLGLIVGEWVFIGGDDTNTQLGDNVGYARVGNITDQTLRLDKTTFDVSEQSAGSLAVELFFGNVIRNEKDPDLIDTRYYEFMRTLGLDMDGRQSEYITRAVANELTLNVPVTDKVTSDITYIAATRQSRKGAEGPKVGDRVSAPSEDAYNTSSDVYRIAMYQVDPLDSNPLSFFGFLSEYEIAINNNVSGVKAIGRLGNIDVNVGNFDVGGELTAYFTDVEATIAVEQNADVTVDAIFAARNSGLVWDIPLMGLEGGEVTVTADEPVTFPVTQMGAENPAGYTLLHVNFPYLPDVAMPTND